MRRLIVALMALLAVAGCSGSSNGGKASSRAPSSSASATSSSPSVDTSAELRKWGSLVARLEAPVVKARANLDAQCPPGTDVSTTLQCDLLAIDLNVQVFDSSFQVGERDLGQPPPELTTLVSDTAKDAATVHAAYAPVGKSCGPQMTQDCEIARFKYLTALDALTSDFDAWRPYTS